MVTKARARAEIIWGGVDQGFSSATNLGLSILAGRFLGASGLGLTYLGFTAYLVALSFVRGFITEPFVVATAALNKEEREASTRACMTLVFAAAIVITLLMGGIGLLVGDPLGRGLLVFSPWVGAAMVQDQWRSVLFRDQRGKSAAINDGVWAAGMVVLIPMAWAIPNDWSVTATWGGGAAAAAIFGLWQVGLRPSGLLVALRWWKRHLQRLGWWLGMENIIITIGWQATIILLATVLNAADLGGIRVAQVAFGPMSLVGEAFLFPGIPIMSRALAASMTEARRWAWRLGLFAASVVGAYLAIVIPLRHPLLVHVFGPQFARFSALVLPVVTGQMIMAGSIGFAIFMRADRRVHAIVLSRLLNTFFSLVMSPILAIRYGVVGGMWGLSMGSALGCIVLVIGGFFRHDIPLSRADKLLISSGRSREG